MPKNVPFEKLKLLVKQCNQTGQFQLDKIGGKLINSNETFWVIFKQCGTLVYQKTLLKENLCHTSAEVCSIEELLVLPKHSMRQAYHNSPIFLTTLTPLIGKIKWDEANNFDINKEKLNLEVEKSRLYFSNFTQCLKITQNVSFNFWVLASSINCCHTKTDLPGYTVWPKASGFQKFTIFGIFHQLLSTQNVNIARVARNFEWDFLSIFKTILRPSRLRNRKIRLYYKMFVSAAHLIIR